MSQSAAAVVWLVSDGKPGHHHQLQGLGQRLCAHGNAQLVWVAADYYPVSLWRALRGTPPATDLPTPSMVVAAGQASHRWLMAWRQDPAVLTAVLMRPSFPRHWVDLAVIPAHDQVAAQANTLVTQGVLNAIEPSELPDAHNGLMLIGGPSRHYHWQSSTLISQILTLVDEYSDRDWTLATSRRTPAHFVDELRRQRCERLTVLTPEQTEGLAAVLARHQLVWATPDSVSMVYESLTAGRPTGVFALAAKRSHRVVRGLNALVDCRQVWPWSQRHRFMETLPQPAPLWEADRAAQWLWSIWRDHREQCAGE